MKKPIRFGLIGEFQSGKSLLTNCLLQRSVATVGRGSATTHTVVNYQYGEEECVKLLTKDNTSCIIPLNEFGRLDTSSNVLVADVYIKNDFLKNFILTDIPGFGANDSDNELAKDVLKEVDFAILIASSDKSFGNDTDSFKSLSVLKEYRIPYYFLLNCTKSERWRCDDDGNIEIAKQDIGMLSFYPPVIYPLYDGGMNIVNLMWYWYSICNNDDELINRKANQQAFKEYGIEPSIKEQLREVSNFCLIQKIFSMENRGFLEIKQSIREEINALRKELCPVGTIQAFATNSIPLGWVVCDGRALSIKEYPDLYWAIGSIFGMKDDDNFIIPDLRGRFIRGWDNVGKEDKDREFGSMQEDCIQYHSHLTSCSEAGYHKHRIATNHWTRSYANTFFTDMTYREPCDYSSTSKDYDCGGAGGHTHSIQVGDITNSGENPETAVRCGIETRPKNVALLFCIKAYEPISTSLEEATCIATSSMKSPGEGVYEKFAILDGSLMIKSDDATLKHPISVVFHDANGNVYSQRVNHGSPIHMRKDGVYFIRFLTSSCKDKTTDDDLLEIYHIESLCVCGDFSNWDYSLNLSQKGSTLLFEGDFTIPKGDHEFKIRVNDNWDIELGGDAQNLGSWLGSNLSFHSEGTSLRFVLDLSSVTWSIHVEE